MTVTRKNVWELGGDWAPEILWYARGVKLMKDRALKEPLSWRFFGAMHGFEENAWEQLGYLGASDAMPDQSDTDTFWEQCQHGSWYFLPWHRGYLIALEAAVRDAIKQANGPADTWALPYWNYFKPKQNGLPPAFGSKDWPDGKGDNPLFVEQRYGPADDGKVYVAMNQVDLKALGHRNFVGAATGGSPGFGGPSTKFHHSRGAHGGLESQPHDMVHSLVGGGDEQRFGVMSDPDTAGLDPIFWLHHANIDRLWEVWKKTPTAKGDPTDPKWVGGPTGIGQRKFVMPMPDGTSWTYTPGQMSDLSKLSYTYDDLTPPAVAPPMPQRLQILGASPETAARLMGAPVAAPEQEDVELLGANEAPMPVVGASASADVQLKDNVRTKLSASSAMRAASVLPDRVFLNLENVTGRNDAAVFNIYINVPAGQDPAQHPERKAGSISLFGVSSASNPDRGHAGEGISFVLEISAIVDQLHLGDELTAGKLHVQLVPLRPVSAEANIRIGRISVYRQSA